MNSLQRSGTLVDRFGSRVREHEVMRDHTPLGVGGVADFFLRVESIDELIDAVTCARESSTPFTVIGGGSQCVFSDFGYPGIVIENHASGHVCAINKSQIIVESGASARSLAFGAASHDLGGLEFLASYSGSIGGAVYSNYMVDNRTLHTTGFVRSSAINDYCKKVTVLNKQSEIVTYNPSWLRSARHTTRLRTQSRETILLTMTFQLFSSKKEEIVRKLSLYSAQHFPDKKISAMVFIDPLTTSAHKVIVQSGAHKLRVGNARLCKESPNRIQTVGDAQAADVRALIDSVRQRVFDKCNVMLEDALDYIGEW